MKCEICAEWDLVHRLQNQMCRIPDQAYKRRLEEQPDMPRCL